MASENSVTLVGNITRDPELRFTQGGRGVASFGLAVNRRYQQNGEWQEQTSFFNITAWAELGENAAASLTKGARVIVTGRLQQREYETREGEKRTIVEVIADELGPSLRWAQAQVERIQRDSADGGGNSGGGNSDLEAASHHADRYPFSRQHREGPALERCRTSRTHRWIRDRQLRRWRPTASGRPGLRRRRAVLIHLRSTSRATGSIINSFEDLTSFQ